jgi:lipopolysaccharide assembly outer membrane protein LptD (OstA)
MPNNFFFILCIGLVFLKTNIVYSQQKDIYNFSADKLTYSQDNSIIEATGNVVAKNQDGKQIASDKIIYNKITQQLNTYGNSKFSDGKGGTLFAESFEYNLEKKNNLSRKKSKIYR